MTATTGRLLALNLAATTDREDVRSLIQRHLDLYSRDEVVGVLAVALATLAGDILAPAVNLMTAGDEWREANRDAVRQILAGPTTEEKEK
ncbi:hypothetical protein G6016_12485 [Dietzia aerolata]|uniref:Uncharacterized protein n=1 Tax=Dietzia aerolata TaxID=595984 RepID=A0ABV5JTE4_9ACTN|nr:hypothetical protein [Dietzia aerolata]MBB0969758.1 hypothetical protein [Dietzia aerolata]